MSRAATPLRQPQPLVNRDRASGALPGLPRAPLTTEQQLAALKRVQEQADQRVKLGAQFFKAAEARTSEYRQILEQLKTEQENLRGQMQRDVTQSFHTYDQWIGNIEEGFTTALQGLESKIGRLQSDWAQTQERIEGMMKRSEAMLDQCRTMLETPAPAIAAPAPGNVGIDSIPTDTISLDEDAPLTVSPTAITDEAPEVPPTPAAKPSLGHSIADAIASTDGDIESPEFYRQVLEKLREQDEA